MVVNFRGKDLNAAGVRVSGTKITAAPDEINQALDGISADVTAANLSELTGGAETDLHSHAASGSGLPLLVFVDGLGGLLNDTNPHNFALDLGAAAVVEGNWTLNGSGDLVAPVAGLYECVFSVQMQRHATEESLVTCAINSATSDTELGPVLVQAPSSADSSAIDLDARTFTSGVTAGQSFGTLQLTQTNAAATGRNVFARLTIRCLALA